MNYFCMERPSVFRVARTKDVACRGFALRAGAAIDAVMHPCAQPLHSRAIAPPMATIRGEEATLDGVGIGGGGGGGGGGGAREVVNWGDAAPTWGDEEPATAPAATSKELGAEEEAE